MKSIITTYPDFQALPRGVKMMLLASENYFFSEVKSRPAAPKAAFQAGHSVFLNPTKTVFSTDHSNRRQQ